MEVVVIKKLILSFLFVAFANAHAYHYGMAGCGVGSLVFQDQPGGIQIAAATTNNLISPQTSAITSGTSGCYDTESRSAYVNYIEINKLALKLDVSRGSGETLDSLLAMLKCKNNSNVKLEIKNNFNGIFKSEKTEEIYDALKSNKTIKNSCNILG
jgi:hypothetical protein